MRYDPDWQIRSCGAYLDDSFPCFGKHGFRAKGVFVEDFALEKYGPTRFRDSTRNASHRLVWSPDLFPIVIFAGIEFLHLLQGQFSDGVSGAGDQGDSGLTYWSFY